MQGLHIAIALGVALFASTAATAKTDLRTPAPLPEYQVSVDCEYGTAYVGIDLSDDGTHLPIGAISKRGGKASASARLMRPDVRRWVVQELFGEQDGSKRRLGGTEASYQFSACLDGPGPDPIAATVDCAPGLSMGTCTTQEEGGSDCDGFPAFCSATGGQGKYRTCTW